MSRGADRVRLAGLLALLTATALARPLLPVDETRYASVAWEMWSHGSFLVPLLDGQPYPHKPPLLFWLMHAGWAVFGVNAWWPKLISPLFTAGTLALTAALARRLWPGLPEVAGTAPFILLASLLFSYFASALMFDAMLTFFVVLGFVGLAQAWRDESGVHGYALFALGVAGGAYAKGPVVLAHLMPMALLAPVWMREHRPRWGRWYLACTLSAIAATLAVLAWAIPAGAAGGGAYREAIFWGQTAGRMAHSFAHRSPWWYYLAALPLLLAPWLLWPRWWRGVRPALRGDSGTLFVVLGSLLALVFFSAVSGKRWHYLLPEFPLFALLVARGLEGSRAGRWSLAVPGVTIAGLGMVAMAMAPWLRAHYGGVGDAHPLWWAGALVVAVGLALAVAAPGPACREVRRIATAVVLATGALLFALELAIGSAYDVQPIAHELKRLERNGQLVAVVGNSQGQWTFAGRLPQAPVELTADEVRRWLQADTKRRAVVMYHDPDELPPGLHIERTRRYRGGWVAIVGSWSG